MVEPNYTEIFIKEIELIHKEINRLLSNTKKKGVKNYTLIYLRERLSNVRNVFSQAKSIHAKLLALTPEVLQNTHEYFQQEKFNVVYESYELVEDYLNNQIELLTPITVEAPTESIL